MADSGGTYAKHKHQKTEQNRANPNKFYTRFLYKAIIVSIFLALLLIFPSQAPDFINQTLQTRGWELLHIVFVGIAVSYGLFSHRNEEIDKENKENNNNHSKADSAQNYVSRLLQVSSVFDDETENLSGTEENKMQTWSNQYHRNEPVVVMAKDHSVVRQGGQQRSRSLRIGDRPLLLPVRSLKSRVVDSDVVDSGRGSHRNSSSLIKSGSKRFSGNDGLSSEDNLHENVVLPSPIPWRSRSGRMEVKDNVVSPPMESDTSRLESESLRSQIPRLSRTNSPPSPLPSPRLSPTPSLSSPKKPSPSPPSSSESQAKSAEDFLRKKSFYRPPPPPPPPPPPAYVVHKSLSVKPSLSVNNDNEVSFKKDFKRSYTGEPRDSSKTRVDSSMTVGSSDSVMAGTVDKAINENDNIQIEKDGRAKTVTFGQTSFMPNPSYMEFAEQGKEEYVDKVVVQGDVDTESDDNYSDDNGGNRRTIVPENERGSSNDEAGGPPDVDKKADEFIAKFREQIRLQRIESIKRSSAQMSRRR